MHGLILLVGKDSGELAVFATDLAEKINCDFCVSVDAYVDEGNFTINKEKDYLKGLALRAKDTKKWVVAYRKRKTDCNDKVFAAFSIFQAATIALSVKGKLATVVKKPSDPEYTMDDDADLFDPEGPYGTHMPGVLGDWRNWNLIKTIDLSKGIDFTSMGIFDGFMRKVQLDVGIPSKITLPTKGLAPAGTNYSYGIQGQNIQFTKESMDELKKYAVMDVEMTAKLEKMRENYIKNAEGMIVGAYLG